MSAGPRAEESLVRRSPRRPEVTIQIADRSSLERIFFSQNAVSLTPPAHPHARFDVRHRPHTSPFDARGGSLKEDVADDILEAKKLKVVLSAGFEPALFRTGT